MRGVSRLVLISLNIIALAYLTMGLWKLRADFSTHWHHGFSEPSVSGLTIPSLLSDYRTQTFTVNRRGVAGRGSCAGVADKGSDLKH